MRGQMDYWSPPPWDSREGRALHRLSLAKRPAGVVVPPAVWVAAARESGLRVHLVKRLAKRAAAGGDPRVEWYGEHLTRLRRRTSRGASDLARARQADWLRRRWGLPWARIARLCGYSEAGNGISARKMVAHYRKRLASGDTLPKARIAYKRRERGEPWAMIAHRVGYATARSARVMARRFAMRAGKRWPMPVRDAPSAD